MDLFSIGFLPIRAVDILDIGVVAYIFYQLFRLMRGTRGATMLVGLLIIILISIIAPWLRMSGLSWLIGQVRTVGWVIAFAILFHPELRRILVHIGQSRVVRLFYKAEQTPTLNEIVDAVKTLSEKGYGALIVLVREVGVGAIIETGVKINARVSSALLASIFTPRTPLHDGAVVIQEGMIAAAKCLLPISENPAINPSMGMRHRAAIGLSEESDAVMVAVSEETSAVSLAVDGRLEKIDDLEELRGRLSRLLTRA